jgi:K+-sensing histidine kinase KdpD
LAGIAVSWAALPLICAMYAQAQSKPAGMGIGLSIWRSIVEAHGGRMWAGANMPRGATLHITLPASGKSPLQ